MLRLRFPIVAALCGIALAARSGDVPADSDAAAVRNVLSHAGAKWVEAARELLEQRGMPVVTPIIQFGIEKRDRRLMELQDEIYLRFGRREGEGLRAYRETLRSNSGDACDLALACLEHMGYRTPEVVSPLHEGLSHPQVGVRREAASLLARLGPGLRLPSGALLPALRDADEGVRCWSIAVVAVQAPEWPECVPVLAELLEDPSARIASLSARALGGYGRQALPRLKALVGALERDAVCASAAEALSELGELAGSAVPALKKALASARPMAPALPNSFHRLLATGASYELTFSTRDPKEDGRASVLKALRRIGHDFSGAEESVIALTRSESEDCCFEAAVTLLGLGPFLSPDLTRAAASGLLDMIEREKLGPQRMTDSAEAAISALARLGDAPASELSDALRSTSPCRAAGASIALGFSGTQAARHTDQLQRNLTDSPPLLRLCALFALKRAAPSTPAIRKFLAICELLETELWQGDIAEELDCLYRSAGIASVKAVLGASAPRASIPWPVALVAEACAPEVAESEALLRECVERAPERSGLLQRIVAARMLAAHARTTEVPIRLAEQLRPGDPARVEVLAALSDRAARGERVTWKIPVLLRPEEDWPESLMVSVCAVKTFGGSRELAEQLLGWIQGVVTRVRDIEDEFGVHAGLLREETAPWVLRLVLCAALRKTEPRLARELEKLLQRTASDRLRRVVLDAMGTWPAPDPESQRVLREYMEAGDSLVSLLAARAFWACGGSAEFALPVLTQALRTRWATRAYDSLRTGEDEGVVFYGSPETPNVVHHVALRTLSSMGEDARAALPAIRACIDGPEPLTRILAVEALARVGGEAYSDRIVEYLKRWRRWDWGLWTLERATEACRVMGEIAGPDPSALSVLEELETIPGEIGKSARSARIRILAGGSGGKPR